MTGKTPVLPQAPVLPPSWWKYPYLPQHLSTGFATAPLVVPAEKKPKNKQKENLSYPCPYNPKVSETVLNTSLTHQLFVVHLADLRTAQTVFCCSHVGYLSIKKGKKKEKQETADSPRVTTCYWTACAMKTLQWVALPEPNIYTSRYRIHIYSSSVHKVPQLTAEWEGLSVGQTHLNGPRERETCQG